MFKYRLAIMLFYLAMAFPCISLYAQVWEISDTVSEKNMVITNLLGDNERTAHVISPQELDETEILLISSNLNTIWGIPGLTGKKSNISVSNDGQLRIVIYPESLNYLETDYTPNLPGGIGFYYNTALFYDVTLKVREYIAKVNGIYISPQDFLKRIALAKMMPDRFLYGDRILARVDRLEKIVLALCAKYPVAKQIDPSLIVAAVSLYNSNPDILPKDAVKQLTASGIKTNLREVKAIFQVMIGIF
ncbi:MAG: hypothetical protein Ta2F_16270 [Termitinemataceae bacterium]|nr:MAG: hypothetical protein Ta2F_16270 [Termitinemataceae bacterium]